MNTRTVPNGQKALRNLLIDQLRPMGVDIDPQVNDRAITNENDRDAAIDLPVNTEQPEKSGEEQRDYDNEYGVGL